MLNEMDDIRKLANETWLRGSVDLEETCLLGLYGKLQDPAGFDQLMSLDFFDKLCWPVAASSNANSEPLVLSIALIMYTDWSIIEDSHILAEENATEVLSKTLDRFVDLSKASSSSSHAVLGLCALFSHLEEPAIRSVVSQYLSIGTWTYLPETMRNGLIERVPALSKVWRKYLKKIDKNNTESQCSSKKASWVNDIISSVQSIGKTDLKKSSPYLFAVTELLLIVIQQLPSRRYLLAYIKSSAIVQSLEKYGQQLNDQIYSAHVSLLRFYAYYPFDEFTGEALNEEQHWNMYAQELYAMQQKVFSSERLKSKLPLLPVSNFGSVTKILTDFENTASEADVKQVVEELTSGYVSEHIDTYTKLAWFKQQYTWESYGNSASSFDYSDVFGPLITEIQNRLVNYGPRTLKLPGPLPMPFLGSQYLSPHDFVLRAYNSEKLKYLVHLRRLFDGILQQKQATLFGNVLNINVIDTAPSLIGELAPDYVTVEAKARVDESWLKGPLSKKNHLYTYFLLELKEGNTVGRIIKAKLRETSLLKPNRARKLVDDSEDSDSEDRFADANSTLTLTVQVDDITGINAIIRLESKETRQDGILQLVSKIANKGLKGKSVAQEIPSWLTDCFLGFGGISHEQLDEMKLKSIDMKDTFLNQDHLRESTEITADNAPPYKLIRDDNGNLHAVSYVDSLDSAPEAVNSTRFRKSEIQSMLSALDPGLTLISTSIASTDRVNTLFRRIVYLLYSNIGSQSILVLTKSEAQLTELFAGLEEFEINPRDVLRLSSDLSIGENTIGNIKSLFKMRATLLEQVDKLADYLDIPGAHGESCELSGYFYLSYIEPILRGDDSQAKRQLAKFYPGCSEEVAVHRIEKLFGDLSSIRPFELFDLAEQTEYLLNSEAKVVGTTISYFFDHFERFQAEKGFKYQNLIIMETQEFSELQSYLSMANPDINRVIMQAAPKQLTEGSLSLFERLIKIGFVAAIDLTDLSLYRPELLPGGSYAGRPFNPGLAQVQQFVYVSESREEGAKQKLNADHMYNMAEANYVVTLYQYMRLLGYPKEIITLVGLSMEQCNKIRSLVEKRCTNNDLNLAIYGEPTILPMEKYTTNDYVVVSLTATTSLPSLRFDLPRARLGLYVIGKLDDGAQVSNKDIKRIFDETPDMNLQIVTGELYKTKTRSNQRSVPMVGLAHLESYVREMNNQRYAYEKGRKP